MTIFFNELGCDLLRLRFLSADGTRALRIFGRTPWAALDQSTRDGTKKKTHIHNCQQTQDSLIIWTPKVHYLLYRSQPSIHNRHQVQPPPSPCTVCSCVRTCLHVHSVQQKPSVLKFPMSRSGSDVSYNCRHNPSRLSFPIFVHSWRLCLPFITLSHAAFVLTEDTNTFD